MVFWWQVRFVCMYVSLFFVVFLVFGVCFFGVWCLLFGAWCLVFVLFRCLGICGCCGGDFLLLG